MTNHTDNINFTSNINLSHLPIPIGVDVAINNAPAVQVVSVNRNTLKIQIANIDVAGSNVFLTSPNSNGQNGDDIRGHWAKITLSNSTPLTSELYSINLHVSDSKHHHALGEQ